MSLALDLARLGKRAYASLRVDRLVLPLNPVIMRVALQAELVRWIREHRDLEFHDRDSPGHAYEKRYGLYEHLLRHHDLDGPIDYLEFGVGKGHSFRWWREHNRHRDSRLFGFDTFTGLPESFGSMASGTFDTGGRPPDVNDERCTFVAGLFQDTLPGFLDGYERAPRLVVHLDADLYSSTLYALTRLAPRLREGDILVFDEFGVPTHEYRAFRDFAAAYRVRVEVLGAVNNHLQVAMRVVDLSN